MNQEEQVQEEAKRTVINRQEDHIISSIEAIAAIHEQKQGKASHHIKIMECLSRILSKPEAIYLSCLICLLWIWTNLVMEYGGNKPLDPGPFGYLQGAICFGAMIATLVVSGYQRRQGLLADHRAHLDLQINLLAEKKLAKIIALIEELRHDMPQVRDRIDNEAIALSIAVNPEQMSEIIDNEIEHYE